MIDELIEEAATSSLVDRLGRRWRTLASLVCIGLLAWGAIGYFVNG
ncbi:hypothetical protein [Sphingomicrobium aestuariivivum]|nr:hypothetical protein [Sphingomicrobium aestuariivivum]MCJ8190471.1 hypothetical protein [Sphingomicrobium aestuariivivum]